MTLFEMGSGFPLFRALRYDSALMTNTAVTPLQGELTYFEERKKELLRLYQGQFALIKNQELVGTFTKEDEAYQEGVRKFGNTPFLIRRIVEQEPPAAHPALTLGLT